MYAIALNIIHPDILGSFLNSLVFHVFSNCLQAKHMADQIDRLDHVCVSLIGMHVLDESTIDFQEIDAQVFQIGKCT